MCLNFLFVCLQALEELGLNEADLVDDVPSMFQSLPEEHNLLPLEAECVPPNVIEPDEETMDGKLLLFS